MTFGYKIMIKSNSSHLGFGKYGGTDEYLLRAIKNEFSMLWSTFLPNLNYEVNYEVCMFI